MPKRKSEPAKEKWDARAEPSNGLLNLAAQVTLLSDMTTWIFQGNPKIFDVDTYLANQTDVLWGANQGFTMMKAGDLVYFWRSLGDGKAHSGIIASGTITDEPRERPDDAANFTLWKVTPTANLARRVAVRLDVRAKQRILPAVLLGHDPILNELEILKVPNATNFRVKDEQVAPLAQAWNRSAKTPLNVLLADSLMDAVRAWRADAEAQEQSRTWTEQVRIVRPLAATLFANFLDGQTKLSELKESFDRKTRLSEWQPLGLGGPSGAMVLNKWGKNFPEEEMATRLLALLSVPKDIAEAERQLRAFASYLQAKIDTGELKLALTGRDKLTAFVSAVWQFLGGGEDAWPTFYTSARDALLDMGLLLKRGDQIELYLQFVGLVAEIRRMYSLSLDEVHQFLWRPTPAVSVGTPTDESIGSTPETEPVDYTMNEAAEDLFLERTSLEDMLEALRGKKNVILQGPPGVGKTFVAKRLAYLLIGRKELQQVTMVQFHQSYSYEDFVQGFRPTEDGGFRREDGPFFRFCERARQDPTRPHVLIVDEINRGNVSRIFGELLMLLEADKRGPEWAMQLAYGKSNEPPFHIPKNVYVVGTMNTADRSLALVDYALRRRFAFLDVLPGFSSPSFTTTLKKLGVTHALTERIQATAADLNKLISDDPNLGPGYQIGHSYFCDGTSLARDSDWLDRVLRLEVDPLIREYWRDSPDRLAQAQKLLEEA